MNHISNPICDKCGKDVRKTKNLKKLSDGFFCAGCYKEKRLAHREITKREFAGIRKREDLEKEWSLKKQERERKVIDIKSAPKIKGSVDKTKKIKSNAYLSREERQCYFRILLRRGYSEEEADRRIKDIIKQQKEVREYLKSKNKSEEEIKKREIKLMEGLLQ